MTSQYAYLYNQYPFSNDPNAGLLHPRLVAHRVRVRAAVRPAGFEPATPFRPMKFYDEERLLLGKTYKAGETIRLTAPAGVAWTVIDLIDTELVGQPYVKSPGAVERARLRRRPQGPHRLRAGDRSGRSPRRRRRAAPSTSRRGRSASTVTSSSTTSRSRAPGTGTRRSRVARSRSPSRHADGSVHTGVGFYGKDAAAGGSHDVHLSGFAIEGDVRERIDTDQVNAIGGAFHDSSFTDLHIQHTKVGLWFDGPMSNVVVERNVIVDQIADALNFHIGVTDSVARDNFVRNSGDDGLAMWAESQRRHDADERRGTCSTTTPCRPRRSRTASRSTAAPTSRSRTTSWPTRSARAARCTPDRGSARTRSTDAVASRTTRRPARARYELNWNIGLGSIWIYALEGSISGIRVTGDHYLDSTYNAIMLVSDWGVKDLYSISDVSFEDVRVDGTGTSVLSARVGGRRVVRERRRAQRRRRRASTTAGRSTSRPTGSEFSVTDLGGNDGGGTTGPWMAAVGAAQHDHVRRPPAGGRTACALAVGAAVI